MQPVTHIVGNKRWPDARVVALDGTVMERTTFVCPFCCEERRDGGTHLRVREVPGSEGEETIVRIPHLFAA